MPTQPSWQDIYGGPLPTGLPAAPTVTYPHVPDPKCPDHCSGRHEVDGQVVCDHCRTPAYLVWMHEWPGRSGIYWSGLQPVNGMPPYVKGTMTNVTCVACGKPLRRR